MFNSRNTNFVTDYLSAIQEDISNSFSYEKDEMETKKDYIDFINKKLDSYKEFGCFDGNISFFNLNERLYAFVENNRCDLIDYILEKNQDLIDDIDFIKDLAKLDSNKIADTTFRYLAEFEIKDIFSKMIENDLESFNKYVKEELDIGNYNFKKLNKTELPKIKLKTKETDLER